MISETINYYLPIHCIVNNVWWIRPKNTNDNFIFINIELSQYYWKAKFVTSRQVKNIYFEFCIVDQNFIDHYSLKDDLTGPYSIQELDEKINTMLLLV